MHAMESPNQQPTKNCAGRDFPGSPSDPWGRILLGASFLQETESVRNVSQLQCLRVYEAPDNWERWQTEAIPEHVLVGKALCQQALAR